MQRKIKVIYDGEMLRPIEPHDLVPGMTYEITSIERIYEPEPASEAEVSQEDKREVWDLLAEIAGTVEAPADWSSQTDHYLYGTPKREEDSEQ